MMWLLVITFIYFSFGRRNRNKIFNSLVSVVSFIVTLPFRLLGLIK